MRTVPRPSPRFADVMQDLMSHQKSVRAQDRGPLILSGRIDSNDLRFLTRFSLAITKGCMRHLVYLGHHLGSCLQGSDVPIAASLLPEYREHMKALFHGQIASRQSCPLEGLGGKLYHANHLLYMIVDQLSRSSGSVTGEESLSYISPGGAQSLKFSGGISRSEIRFLRRIVESLGSLPQKIGIVPHILFMSLATGMLPKEREGQMNSCVEVQQKYRSHVTERTVKILVRNRLQLDVTDGKGATCGECLSGNETSLFRGVFDAMADEYLVKTAAVYLHYTLNQETVPSVADRKEPEYAGLRSMAD